MLRLFDENNREAYALLSEDWVDTKVNVGDYVNIIGNFKKEPLPSAFSPSHHISVATASQQQQQQSPKESSQLLCRYVCHTLKII